jgi:23S rRNA (adenine2030-N6)-methyltransferase
VGARRPAARWCSAYVDQVRAFNDGPELRQYPGSPAMAHQLMREQDQLRLFELHATDHGQLAGRMRGDARVEVQGRPTASRC